MQHLAHRNALKLILALLPAAFCASMAQVDTDAGVETTLLRLEAEWAQVDVNQNKSLFQRILAPDFISTSRSGKFLASRDAYIAAWEYEDVKRAQNSELRVKIVSPDVAVVTGMDTTSGTKRDGRAWRHRDRFTDTWVRRDGQWRCVAAHVTRID